MKGSFIKMGWIVLSAVPVGFMLLLWFMALASQEGRAVGLVDGKLSPCPEKPNCVCSEKDALGEHFIEPLSLGGKNFSAAELSTAIAATLESQGGRVQLKSNIYLSATFKSPVFGFVDDVEVRIDREQNLLFFRSASRVGYYDFGANRRRIQRLSQLLSERLSVGQDG